MATNINITSNGKVITRITFDVAARKLRYETGMTDAGTKRAIGDAIRVMAVTPENQARARVELEQLHAQDAPVDAFAREIMNVMTDVLGGGNSDTLPEDFDVELGDWNVSPDEIPPDETSVKPMPN